MLLRPTVPLLPLVVLTLAACGGSDPDSAGYVPGFVESLEAECDPRGEASHTFLPGPGVVVSVVGCQSYESKRVCDPDRVASWWFEDTLKVGYRCTETDRDPTVLILWAPTGN